MINIFKSDRRSGDRRMISRRELPITNPKLEQEQIQQIEVKDQYQHGKDRLVEAIRALRERVEA